LLLDEFGDGIRYARVAAGEAKGKQALREFGIAVDGVEFALHALRKLQVRSNMNFISSTDSSGSR